MKEFQYEKAIVRILGTYDPDKLRRATVEFMKKVERSKKENGDNNSSRAISKK